MRLTIEKLIYGGDGLARMRTDSSADATPSPRSSAARGLQPPATKSRETQARGKAVFIPFTLAGETVEASLTEEKSGFARARLDKVLTPSPERVEPPCSYYQRCGGCQYQHARYEQQLAIKKAILDESLRRQGKVELQTEIRVHAAEPWHYRNRSRFQVRTTPEFCAGYLRFNSHEVLAVEECPISSVLINRALGVVWQLGRAGLIPAELHELEFFANADDSRLLAELWFAASTPPEKRIALGEKLTAQLRDHLPNLTSSYVFAHTASRTGEEAPLPDWALGGGEFRYHAGGSDLRVSGGAFFQVNGFLVERLVELVVAGRAGELAIDLFAGVGLFSVALAKSFRHILAVESSQSAAADLKYNAPANAKVIRTKVEEFLAGKARHGKPDFIVVDPPRAGLGERVARALAAKEAPRITYVSCDPTTLARDLVPLQAGGYRIEQVHLVDLFPQTFHLETIVELVR